MDWITTTTLLRALRSSDSEVAWRDFVARFRTPIVHFARSLGLHPADAEDAAQDTLLAFLEGFRSGRYDPSKGRLSGWLFGIAYHQVLRERRRLKRSPPPRPDAAPAGEPGLPAGLDLPDEPAATDLWDRHWEESLLRECLARARAEFQPGTFRAFELVALGDRSPGEAAAEIGVPVKAIYNAKHRVLRRIRELRAEIEEYAAVAAPSEP